ncbi:MAG TPA: winged helix-turn-helix domain-containing protein [Chthoniobacter sp.]|nr:winged helix-turn-helix domain-containing protein [Chthoniobacter sp.]
MVHHFSVFEIDEPAREVRAGARVLPLQPRVFDLLVYLAKNRDRVVSKDELLDNIWADVTVADGSLQRAISLARAALADVGATDVIRTYSRKGYRFCDGDPGCSEPVPASPPAAAKPTSHTTPLDRAHTACEEHDWLAAIVAFEEVDGVETLSADDLHCWALAAQHAGQSRNAIPPLERAVTAYTKLGDKARAGWVALHLAQLHLEWREPILANGWYQRAQRLLDPEPPCRERGYLALVGCRMHLYQNDLDKALSYAEIAHTAGELFDDPDLESLGLVYVGVARLFLGRIREGLAAIDEAGASVTGGDLSPWAGGLIYCCVIFSCVTRADWHRASHWTDQFDRWGKDKGITAYPGLCQLHRAEMLAVRGELRQAESEIRLTCERLAQEAPWVEGEAWRVLGQILITKGDFVEARTVLARATELGWESQFDLALLRMVEGDSDGAATLLARMLAENTWTARSRRGRTLAQYCITASLAGRVQEARGAMAELDQDPELSSTPALQAYAMQARGELTIAEGHRAEGIALLRRALGAWHEVGVPMAVAHGRLRLAMLLSAEGDHEAAMFELDAAHATFRRCGAEGWLTICAHLRAKLEPACETIK